MSNEGLSKALQLYKDAVANNDLVGAVLLVADTERVLLHEAVGFRDRQKNLPMEKDTLFRMASMTKPIIATSILILAERGKLKLDDPVYTYVPSFRDGLAGKILINHLLNHTSGFRIPTNYLSPLVEKSERHPDAPNLQIEVARFGDAGPSREPGTSYSYSNPGYNTLGAIIEIVSGKPLSEFLKDEIHGPLDARDSFHHLDELDDPSRLATSNEKIDGEWTEYKSTMDIPIIVPAGSLISTASDYLEFCRLFLNRGTYGGKRILGEESIKRATTKGVFTEYPYPTPSELQERGLIPRWYYRRAIGGGFPDLKEPNALGLDTSYGYGWTIAKDGAFSHGGVHGTFGWVDPGRGITGLILTQDVGGVNPGVEFMEAVNASV